MNTALVTSVLSREWRPQAPATPSEIDELLTALPFELPREYVELLRVSNGGEGELALSPLWFQLFDTRLALHLWNDQHRRTSHPGLYFFGSNGGLESIAMDMSQSEPWPIIAVDAVAGPESSLVIANSFAEFLAQVGFRNSEA